MSLEGQEVWDRVLQQGGEKTSSYIVQPRERNKRNGNEKSEMSEREINSGKVRRSWEWGCAKSLL